MKMQKVGTIVPAFRTVTSRRVWWRSVRATKVVEIVHPAEHFVLDGMMREYCPRQLLTCTYHDTEVVRCDYDKQTITLRNNGFKTRTTLIRINTCAWIYQLPLNVFRSKENMFVEMWDTNRSRDSLKVVRFEDGMVIPMKPDVIHTPGLTNFYFQYKNELQESAPYLLVEFQRSHNGTLRLKPRAARWSRWLKNYLKTFNTTWPGYVDLGPIGELKSVEAMRLWLNVVEEGLLISGETITKRVPTEEFLRRYVGFDSEIWLT